MNQQEIDLIIHGKEIETQKLTDEEINSLLSALSPGEVNFDELNMDSRK